MQTVTFCVIKAHRPSFSRAGYVIKSARNHAGEPVSSHYDKQRMGKLMHRFCL